MHEVHKLGIHLIQAAIVMFTISGCATILNGGFEDLQVSSTPSGATVTVFGISDSLFWRGATPATIKLKRGNGFFQGAAYRVEISKNGYATQTVTISSSVNGGWYILGNLLDGGIIGWLIVDPASGAMWTLAPDNINANLQQQASWLRQKDGLVILLRKDVPDSLFRQLNPTLLKSEN